MYLFSSPVSSLFEEFQHLSLQEPQAIIRFFERYEADMGTVPAEELFVMRFHYANALFEVGAYRIYLNICDGLIETSMACNWDMIEGKDVFLLSLEQKAWALVHLGDLAQAERVALALQKIKPDYLPYRQLLRRVWTAQRPRWVLEFTALALWLGIFAVVLGLGNVLAFEAFFPVLAQITQHIIASAALMSVLLLFSGFLGQWYWVERRLGRKKS